jgi:hypothetical protein
MSETIEEVAGLLRNSGILANLAADAQAEREVERLSLFERLQAAEQAEQARAEKLRGKRDELRKRVDAAETTLKQARAALAELEAGGSMTADKLRGQLRRLADPAYLKALAELSRLFDQARHGFQVGHGVVRTLHGKRPITESNSLQIAETLAAIRETRLRVEAMQEQPRPDDLPEVLEGLLSPLRLGVRSIAGYS